MSLSEIKRVFDEAADLAPPDAVFEKIHFSCSREDGFLARLDDWGRGQIVLAGMETHVCVLQTALPLLEVGYQVFLVADATGSRRPSDRNAAMARLAQADGIVVTAEMVLFEWLERGDTPTFREILKLIK